MKALRLDLKGRMVRPSSKLAFRGYSANPCDGSRVYSGIYPYAPLTMERFIKDAKGTTSWALNGCNQSRRGEIFRNNGFPCASFGPLCAASAGDLTVKPRMTVSEVTDTMVEHDPFEEQQ